MPLVHAFDFYFGAGCLEFGAQPVRNWCISSASTVPLQPKTPPRPATSASASLMVQLELCGGTVTQRWGWVGLGEPIPRACRQSSGARQAHGGDLLWDSHWT